MREINRNIVETEGAENTGKKERVLRELRCGGKADWGRTQVIGLD